MHSEWFPPEIDPVRPGPYQRDYADPGDPPVLQYCCWDGLNWFAGCDTLQQAVFEMCVSTVPARWRGLTISEFTERHMDLSRALDRRIQDAMP